MEKTTYLELIKKSLSQDFKGDPTSANSIVDILLKKYSDYDYIKKIHQKYDNDKKKVQRSLKARVHRAWEDSKGDIKLDKQENSARVKNFYSYSNSNVSYEDDENVETPEINKKLLENDTYQPIIKYIEENFNIKCVRIDKLIKGKYENPDIVGFSNGYDDETYNQLLTNELLKEIIKPLLYGFEVKIHKSSKKDILYFLTQAKHNTRFANLGYLVVCSEDEISNDLIEVYKDGCKNLNLGLIVFYFKNQEIDTPDEYEILKIDPVVKNQDFNHFVELLNSDDFAGFIKKVKVCEKDPTRIEHFSTIKH